MEEIKTINPPFFGQLEIRGSNIGVNKNKNTNTHGILLGFFCCIILGLSVAAIFHRQWACLLCIFLMCLPLVIILFLTRTQNWTHTNQTNDGREMEIADWLETQTRRGVFGSLLTKSAKPVWLVKQGVVVYRRTVFPWSRFASFALENSTLVRELKPIHRLRLVLKEPRTVSREFAFFAIVLLFAPIIIGSASLIYYFPRIGMRYDVLALCFAGLAVAYLFVSMTYRYVRERVTENTDLIILFDQQRIQSEQLVSFLHEMLLIK